MVLISQIITEAYRESNNIAIGQTPTAAEQAEGLLLFNRFLRSVLGNEAGDPFTPIAIGNNNVQNSAYYNIENIPGGWFPPPNIRILFNNKSAQTLALNPNPDDGERIAINDASGNFSTYPVTVIGNGRTIDGATQVVLNTNSGVKEYFYRADTNNWATVNDLQLSDPLPFPEEFEDYFIIGTAIRINPRNTQQLDPQSMEAFKRLGKQFKARYNQDVEQKAEEGLLRTSGIRRSFFRLYGPYINGGQRFNLGW